MAEAEVMDVSDTEDGAMDTEAADVDPASENVQDPTYEPEGEEEDTRKKRTPSSLSGTLTSPLRTAPLPPEYNKKLVSV